jgi:hypothetical protein
MILIAMQGEDQMMTDAAYPDGTRYRVSIARVPGGAAALEVHDNVRGCPLLGWQGDVARQMLDSGILPAEYCRAGCHGCDKSLVQRLIMAGAAAEMRIRAVEDATH